MHGQAFFVPVKAVPWGYRICTANVSATENPEKQNPQNKGLRVYAKVTSSEKLRVHYTSLQRKIENSFPKARASSLLFANPRRVSYPQAYAVNQLEVLYRTETQICFIETPAQRQRQLSALSEHEQKNDRVNNALGTVREAPGKRQRAPYLRCILLPGLFVDMHSCLLC